VRNEILLTLCLCKFLDSESATAHSTCQSFKRLAICIQGGPEVVLQGGHLKCIGHFFIAMVTSNAIYKHVPCNTTSGSPYTLN